MSPVQPAPQIPPAAVNGPLTGIVVLDLSSYLAGPYGCTLLGDMGADVIKIEAPSGDNMRHYPSTIAGDSRAFIGVNRNKRSVVLNLKGQASLAAFYRLVEQADVVVENFRPDVAARLKIDYRTLAGVKPDVIQCSLTGYGAKGPLNGKGGFDQVLQSMTGIAMFQTDYAGMPQLVRGSIVDFYGAALLAQGATAALFQRERTGAGQHVEVSLLGSALAMQAGRFVWVAGEARDADRDLQAGGVTGIHPTGDGLIYLQAPTNAFWQALCRTVGLEQFGSDPRFSTLRGRQAHTDEILPRLHSALAGRSAIEWEAAFGTSVPCAVVGRIEDMFDHPQVAAQGHVATYSHAGIGNYFGFRKPVSFGKAGAPEPLPAPMLGQHTREVLARAGLGEEAAAAVEAEAVVPKIVASQEN